MALVIAKRPLGVELLTGGWLMPGQPAANVDVGHPYYAGLLADGSIEIESASTAPPLDLSLFRHPANVRVAATQPEATPGNPLIWFKVSGSGEILDVLSVVNDGGS